MKKRITEFFKNEKGDMAEKTVMWVVILLVAIGAFALLGDQIVAAVEAVADAI
jgi:Flp pilus assembly pilin Flp